MYLPASMSRIVVTRSKTPALSLSYTRCLSPVSIFTLSMNVFGPTSSGFLSYAVP